MKILLVARKSLTEILRELQLLGMELAMPLVFLLITLFMYKAPLQVTYAVWAYNAGAGHSALIEELRAQHYSDGRPVFAITLDDDLAAAETALKDKSAAALLILPSEGNNYTLRGDAISSAFYRASTILETILRRDTDRTEGRLEVVRVAEQALNFSGRVGGGPQTQFDLYAPGMMIFAILLIIPQTAMLVAREIRWRTLRRLRLTRLSAFEFLAGISLAQLVVAALQVVVIFVSAQALGFHNQGSLWLAMLVGLVLSFAAIGMGLIVASFVENDSQAANAGATASMVQVFVSGAFFAMTPLTVFTLAGHQIDLFDISPATSGFLALQEVLSFGAGLREIGFRLGLTLILSGVYFVLGVMVFQRTQMKRQ